MLLTRDRSTRSFASRTVGLIGFAFAVLLSVVLVGCASRPNLVNHQFAFDGWSDKWAEQVDLLEYSYGDQYAMVRDKINRPGQTTVGYSAGASGPMPVGEFLYVKWRVNSTGEVVEEKIDLRNRLSAEMHAHKLTFVTDGKQLNAYLITPHAKPKGQQDLPTYLSYSYVGYEIFPMNNYRP